jgi:hypothetical protein
MLIVRSLMGTLFAPAFGAPQVPVDAAAAGALALG